MSLSVVGALHTRLAADADNITILGSGGGKIFDGRTRVTQGTELPYKVIRRSDTEPLRHLNGTNSLARASVSIENWASPGTPTDAQTLADADRASLNEFSGTITSGADSLVIEYIHWEDEADISEPVRNAQDISVPGVRSEYTVGYTLT